MVRSTIAAVAAAVSVVSAQHIGTRDNHPRLTTQQCSTRGGCHDLQTSVVLDALNHPIHLANGTTCTASSGDNCIIDAVNYTAAGVYTSGSSMTLHMYMNESGKINVPVSPRVYLLDPSGQDYETLKLLNQEFTFTVDVSNLPCGMNGALYLTSMEPDGGRSAVNPAGAAMGTGYCDAQCPKSSFINGAPNPEHYGACCAEMDIWEANVAAEQTTPHPALKEGLFQCNGTDCLNTNMGGLTDEWGCGFNSYKGSPDFYAPGGVVDTSQPFEVVTQFLTTTNTSTGTLNEIRRIYVQNGKVIANNRIPYGNNMTTDSINPAYCNATASTFVEGGGFPRMSENLAGGMTLIFSVWNDQGGNMTWLDTGASGPCNAIESGPSVIVAEDPTTSVTFSNIRWGDINSTYGGNNNNNGHGAGNGGGWSWGWGKMWGGGPSWGKGKGWWQGF